MKKIMFSLYSFIILLGVLMEVYSLLKQNVHLFALCFAFLIILPIVAIKKLSRK